MGKILARICPALAAVIPVLALLLVTERVDHHPALASYSVLTGTPGSECKGWGGVLNNGFGAATGGLQAPIINGHDLGAPEQQGNTIQATGTLRFQSRGSCSSEVAFQMQTKACGAWGCSWETRNHGEWEFLWQHQDTGVITQTVGMGCRRGSNTYRLHMAVVGIQSSGQEQDKNGKGGAIGVEQGEDQSEDGPEIKIDCHQ